MISKIAIEIVIYFEMNDSEIISYHILWNSDTTIAKEIILVFKIDILEKKAEKTIVASISRN